MKERGMLFSAPMVLALLNGSKTQTRRALKVQPLDVIPMQGVQGREWVGLMTRDPEPKGRIFNCRFGQPGDRIWVRETWLQPGLEPVIYRADEWAARLVEKCKSDPAAPQLKWIPSIHMPRWASRITLEITGVRVERLQDISEADAKAEGITSDSVIVGANCNGGRHSEEHAERFFYDGCDDQGFESAVDAYRGLWESLSGTGSWDVNPWVWVIEFKRVKP